MFSLLLSRPSLGALITVCCLTASSALFAASSAPSPLLEEAIAAIAKGELKKAVTLLEAQENELAGQPLFDYWFGVALARSNDPARAMFALERAVQSNPNHAGARMELIGVYLKLKMDDLVRHEITQIEKLNPPPSAMATLQEIKSVLAHRQTASSQNQQNQLLMLSLDIGHDSNVTSSSDTELRIPLFNIPVQFKPTASDYQSTRMVYWKRFQSEGRNWGALTLSGLDRKNQNKDAQGMNLRLFQARGDYTFDSEQKGTFKLFGETGKLWLDTQPYREHEGMGFRYQSLPLREKTLTVGAEWAVRKYRFTAEVNNYIQPSWGVFVQHLWNPQLMIEWAAELEEERAHPNRLQGNAKRIRLGPSIDFQLSPSHRLNLDWKVSRVHYDRLYLANTFYNPDNVDVLRKETTQDKSLTWTWTVQPKWQIALRYQHRQQRSPLAFYRTTQEVWQLSNTVSFW